MKPFETRTEEYRGHKITVKWYYDEDMGPPWKEHDGHGPVSEWTTRDKRPGERVIASDRNSKRYYDYAEAIKAAKRDGWDAPPYKTGTKGERAQRAVEADFEYLKRWCDDEWHWVGRVVTIEGTDYDDSCWGYESDRMNEETGECIDSAKRWLDREIEERAWAEGHEITTEG